MNVYDAIMQRRTIRKFKQQKIEPVKLMQLVDCARMAAYGANMQPLKFAVIDDTQTLAELFPYTKWAAYLPDSAPKEAERPMAYIAVLGDTTIKSNDMFEADAGAAITTMMLMAEELELASCWLGAIDRDKIKQIIGLPDSLKLVYLLALGYPNQISRAVEMNKDVKYFADEQGVINVPKRSLDEVLVKVK